TVLANARGRDATRTGLIWRLLYERGLEALAKSSKVDVTAEASTQLANEKKQVLSWDQHLSRMKESSTSYERLVRSRLLETRLSEQRARHRLSPALMVTEYARVRHLY